MKTYLTLCTLLLATTAMAQTVTREDPFNPPPKVEPAVKAPPSIPSPSNGALPTFPQMPPGNGGMPPGLPPLDPSAMTPPPLMPPTMPKEPEKERIEQKVPVKVLGTVNGRVLLKGDSVYFWHDPEKYDLVREPQGAAKVDPNAQPSAAQGGGTNQPPPPLPSSVGRPEPRR